MMRAVLMSLALVACATPAASQGREVEATALDGRALHRPALTEAFRAEQEGLLAQARAVNEPDHPDAMADAAIWIGRRLGYLGRYREAIRAFEEGEARYPKDARFARHLGHRLISVRRFDDAIVALTRADGLMADRADEIEPDGLPNTASTPLSTLKGNIAYHLGIAHYLRGDFTEASRAFLGATALAANPDSAVAARYWLYLSFARAGDMDAARAALAPIRPDWRIIENTAYFWLALCYSGQGPCERGPGADDTPESAAIAYGLAARSLIDGRTDEARTAMRAIVARDDWASFGYIAAEADLAR